jgi:hypothetical protein
LQATKKHFNDIIESVQKFKQDQRKKEEERKHSEEQKRRQQEQQSQSYDRYQEVQEERFWKERMQGNGKKIEYYCHI